MKRSIPSRRQALRYALDAIGILLVVILAGPVVFSGCSDDGSMMPAIDTTSPQPASDFSIDPGAVVEVEAILVGGAESGGDHGDGDGQDGGSLPDPVIQHWQQQQRFEPGGGGTLELGKFMKLEVPGGALAAVTDISADVWVKSTGDQVEWVVFDYNPPAAFLEPLKLKIDQALASQMIDANGDHVLWYLNAATGRWEVSDIGKVADKWVKFDIHHFSKYALGN